MGSVKKKATVINTSTNESIRDLKGREEKIYLGWSGDEKAW